MRWELAGGIAVLGEMAEDAYRELGLVGHSPLDPGGSMTRAPITRTGDYTKMPSYLAEEAARAKCEVCRRRYGIIDADFIRVRQVIDHIFPVRFLSRLGLDPHVPINVLSCCCACHAEKLVHETKLFGGDVFAFIQGLKRIGYPMNRVNLAAAHYGFRLWPS